jgi:hypothetical protein
MKSIAKQYRQGDVLVTPARIPAGAVRQCQGVITLAEGEVTGHSHTITATAEKVEHYIHDATGEPILYLRVKEPVVLSHQEHAPATLEPGDYIVRRQVEEWMDEVRQVED